MNLLRTATLIIFAKIAISSAALACPSCYGAADSPMTAGMNTAILVMLGIIGFVLVAISTFFGWVWRRSRKNRIQLSEHAFVDEKGMLLLGHKPEGIGMLIEKRNH